MSIPKIIHYTWFGGDKPEYLLENIKSWKKYCPDYKIMEWNEDNWDITANKFAKHFASTKQWGFVSDPIRVDVLRRYGGVYLDADVTLTQSLEPFEHIPLFFSMHYINAVGTALIGSEKGHPVLELLWKFYNDLTEEQIVSKEFDPVSNGIFTRFFIRHYRNFKFTNRKQFFDDGTVIFPNYTFVIPSFFKNENYALHALKGSWQLNKDHLKKINLKQKIKDTCMNYQFTRILILRHSFKIQAQKNAIASEYGIRGKPKVYK